uniref:Transmembrane protein 242 n=1 Tax=Trichuris muris TaxID=70415 RepID=A0A5S6QW44_TRIMR
MIGAEIQTERPERLELNQEEGGKQKLVFPTRFVDVFGGAVLVCLASAAFGAGFVSAFSRSQKRYAASGAKANSSGLALAGKALGLGSLCAVALAGGVAFGTCRLLGISKVDDLTKLKEGGFSFTRKERFGSGRRIDTWQQLLDYISEQDRPK